MLRVVIVLALLSAPAFADKAETKPNLAAFGAGALVVKAPEAYSDAWSGFQLLDEDPTSGYAPKKGDLTPKQFVIELADEDEISELSFDIAGAETGDREAKDVSVDIADKIDGPWTSLVAVTLVKAKNDQHFMATKPATGRYLRVTLKTNFGDPDYMELMGLGAYGKVMKKQPVLDYTGTYTTTYGVFHIKNGVGCYEHKNGLIMNGGFEGRVLRFTWQETTTTGDVSTGPAVLVFPADGKTFLGLWWEGGAAARANGHWDGTFDKKAVANCPHYKFETKPGGDVAQTLNKAGRVRLYGITFDTDSDHIKDESKGTLDGLVAAAKAEPTWKLGIEGHTDASGTADHNQTLSEQRAAAVKAYLVKAGIAADRLTTTGFGATKPVSTNTTSLGRSQNRRVEVAKS
jgi:OmpA-OmpF porin, OOP family